MVRHDGKRFAQKLKVAKLEISKKIKKNKNNAVEAKNDSSEDSAKLPAIFIDIDGVIIKGTGAGGMAIDVIEGADKALKRVMTQSFEGTKIPFAFLTNGGMETEQQKADKMNTLLKFTPEEGQITKENIFLCHTIFGSPQIQSEYSEKMVLVDGCSKDDIGLAHSYGFKKVVTLQELTALYPNISPVVMLDFFGSVEKLQKTKEGLLARYQLSEDEFKKQLQIHAIFVFCSQVRVWTALQVFTDLISTKDGKILGEKRTKKDPQFVKFFMTNPDLHYQDKWAEPRFGPLPLNIMYKSIFKETYGYDMHIEQYGKPYKATFDFAHQQLKERANKQGVQISRNYMIGDNPLSDIAGGNKAGFTTILVKTGVFNADAPTSKNGNDLANPATHVVEDFQAAIDLIFEKEGLKNN